MEILVIIGRLAFRAARPFRYGKPQIPHEYTVRSPESEQDYVALWTAIDGGGVVEYYGRTKRRYLYPGDGRKYWHMGPLYQSRVINRMKIEDDLARLRREGQHAAVEFGTAELARERVDPETGEITPVPEGGPK